MESSQVKNTDSNTNANKNFVQESEENSKSLQIEPTNSPSKKNEKNLENKSIEIEADDDLHPEKIAHLIPPGAKVEYRTRKREIVDKPNYGSKSGPNPSNPILPKKTTKEAQFLSVNAGSDEDSESDSDDEIELTAYQTTHTQIQKKVFDTETGETKVITEQKLRIGEIRYKPSSGIDPSMFETDNPDWKSYAMNQAKQDQIEINEYNDKVGKTDLTEKSGENENLTGENIGQYPQTPAITTSNSSLVEYILSPSPENTDFVSSDSPQTMSNTKNLSEHSTHQRSRPSPKISNELNNTEFNKPETARVAEAEGRRINQNKKPWSNETEEREVNKHKKPRSEARGINEHKTPRSRFNEAEEQRINEARQAWAKEAEERGINERMKPRPNEAEERRMNKLKKARENEAEERRINELNTRANETEQRGMKRDKKVFKNEQNEPGVNRQKPRKAQKIEEDEPGVSRQRDNKAQNIEEDEPGVSRPKPRKVQKNEEYEPEANRHKHRKAQKNEPEETVVNKPMTGLGKYESNNAEKDIPRKIEENGFKVNTGPKLPESDPTKLKKSIGRNNASVNAVKQIDSGSNESMGFLEVEEKSLERSPKDKITNKYLEHYARKTEAMNALANETKEPVESNVKKGWTNKTEKPAVNTARKALANEKEEPVINGLKPILHLEKKIIKALNRPDSPKIPTSDETKEPEVKGCCYTSRIKESDNSCQKPNTTLVKIQVKPINKSCDQKPMSLFVPKDQIRLKYGTPQPYYFNPIETHIFDDLKNTSSGQTSKERIHIKSHICRPAIVPMDTGLFKPKEALPSDATELGELFSSSMSSSGSGINQPENSGKSKSRLPDCQTSIGVQVNPKSPVNDSMKEEKQDIDKPTTSKRCCKSKCPRIQEVIRKHGSQLPKNFNMSTTKDPIPEECKYESKSNIKPMTPPQPKVHRKKEKAIQTVSEHSEHKGLNATHLADECYKLAETMLLTGLRKQMEALEAQATQVCPVQVPEVCFPQNQACPAQVPEVCFPLNQVNPKNLCSQPKAPEMCFPVNQVNPSNFCSQPKAPEMCFPVNQVNTSNLCSQPKAPEVCFPINQVNLSNLCSQPNLEVCGMEEIDGEVCRSSISLSDILTHCSKSKQRVEQCAAEKGNDKACCPPANQVDNHNHCLQQNIEECKLEKVEHREYCPPVFHINISNNCPLPTVPVCTFEKVSCSPQTPEMKQEPYTPERFNFFNAPEIQDDDDDDYPPSEEDSIPSESDSSSSGSLTYNVRTENLKVQAFTFQDGKMVPVEDDEFATTTTTAFPSGNKSVSKLPAILKTESGNPRLRSNSESEPVKGNPRSRNNSVSEPSKPRSRSNSQTEPAKPKSRNNSEPEPVKPQPRNNSMPEQAKPQSRNNSVPEPSKPQSRNNSVPEPAKPQSGSNSELEQTKPKSSSNIEPEPAKPQSRNNSVPEPAKPQSRNNSVPEPAKPQSRNNSVPEAAKPQSRNNSVPEAAKPQSRSNIEPEPSKSQSRSNSEPEPVKPQTRSNSQPEPPKVQDDSKPKSSSISGQPDRPATPEKVAKGPKPPQPEPPKPPASTKRKSSVKSSEKQKLIVGSAITEQKLTTTSNNLKVIPGGVNDGTNRRNTEELAVHISAFVPDAVPFNVNADTIDKTESPSSNDLRKVMAQNEPLSAKAMAAAQRARDLESQDDFDADDDDLFESYISDVPFTEVKYFK